MCVCKCVHVCARASTWRSEDNAQRLVLSFRCVGCQAWQQSPFTCWASQLTICTFWTRKNSLISCFPCISFEVSGRHRWQTVCSFCTGIEAGFPWGANAGFCKRDRPGGLANHAHRELCCLPRNPAKHSTRLLTQEWSTAHRALAQHTQRPRMELSAFSSLGAWTQTLSSPFLVFKNLVSSTWCAPLF